MKKFAVLIILSLVLAMLQMGCGSSYAYKEIKAQDLQKMLDAKANIVLVDVREASDYADGHIPQAINIPVTEFTNRYTELKPNSQIVLICYSGQSSKSAAQFLLGKKYTNVSSVAGGMMSWQGSVTK